MGQESKIQADVVAYAQSFGITAKKLSFGEGWPDFMFLARGKILFIEFKAPGETPSPAQREMIRVLTQHGFTVRVVSDVEEGKTIIYLFYGLHSTWTRLS